MREKKIKSKLEESLAFLNLRYYNHVTTPVSTL